MPATFTVVERFEGSASREAMHADYITRLHAGAMEMCGRTVYGPPSYVLAFMLSVLIGTYWYLDLIPDIVQGLRADEFSAYVGLFVVPFITLVGLAVPILVE
jgi:hypothetical protein